MRLSQLDPDAESAVRIIAFFDPLMRRRVGFATLVRLTAALAECPVGLQVIATGETIRFGPDGTGSASASALVVLDDEPVGKVWLERPGTAHSFDELLVERLAIAAAALWDRNDPAPTTMAGPALVELLIDPTASEAARARALRLLGFASDKRLRLAAVALDDRASLSVVARSIGSGHTKAAVLGTVGAVVASEVVASGIAAGGRVGVGDSFAPFGAVDASRSWAQARLALRFTGLGGERVIWHETLGSRALLGSVPAEALAANPDVRALRVLPSEDLATFEAFCSTGSLRQAAARLHLHHSSIGNRMKRIEIALGIKLDSPETLLRAQMALLAVHLLSNP